MSWKVTAAALGCMALALIAVASEVAAPNASDSSAPPSPVVLDSATLERYAGDYQLGPSIVLSVTREGDRLFAQLTGQPKAEIFARSEGEFFYQIVKAQLSFESDAQGRITGLVLHQNGRNIPAARIDSGRAQQIESELASRIQSQAPAPGSEAALRRLIAGISAGKPNYEEMSPDLATATREQLSQLQSGMAQLGAVQSVEFRGVGNQGWDLYEVKQEHGSSQWRIALNADGLIVGALVSAGP